MIRKWIIWFLVLTFLNFIVIPECVFARSGYMGSPDGEGVALAIGAVVVVGLVIAGIVALAKHLKSPAEQPQDQKQDTEKLSETNLDNQHITPSDDISPLPQEQDKDIEVSPDTHLDEQIFTPTGEVVIVQW